MKTFFKLLLLTVMVLTLVGCGTKNNDSTVTPGPSAETKTNTSETAEITTPETETKTTITPKMAFEGVNAYCHITYDWSIAEENPEIMYVQMGEETEEDYEVVFRSYTGAFVNFYVDKITGNTRIVEVAPGVEEETNTGTINLYDYLAN